MLPVMMPSFMDNDFTLYIHVVQNLCLLFLEGAVCFEMTCSCQKFIFFFFCSPQVEQSKVLIKEGGVQLLLTIVDTPGFGDAVDNSNW